MKTARWSITVFPALVCAGGALWLAWARVRASDFGPGSGGAKGMESGEVLRVGRVSEQIGELRAALGTSTDDLVRDGTCTLEQANRFEETTAARVRFTLDPSLKSWGELAGAWGAAVPKHPVYDGREISPEEFDAATRMLREAEYSWSGAHVRALMIDGKEQEIAERNGSFGNALFRATYPRPGDAVRERVTVLETVVPARLRQADGEVRRVQVGFSHWWQRQADGGRWVPWDVTVYFPPGPVNVKGHVY